jgi:quercetin dioxygenase-like cupin family protein
MAIHHASPGEVIDIRPLGDRLAQAVTSTLAKSDQIEVIRLVLPAGKEIPPHKVASPMTVQCLEGRVEFHAHDRWQTLEPGQMLYLDGGQMHAVKSVEHSSVLITLQQLPQTVQRLVSPDSGSTETRQGPADGS